MRIAILGVLLVAAPMFAGASPPPAPELKALDVQAGHWTYHGTIAPDKAGGKARTFTWDGRCNWSVDKLFLTCSFDVDWSGRKLQSLVVDSWNTHDKSYWHYEVFAVGGSGAKPFVSRMTIHGNTWTAIGEEIEDGRKNYDRITYVYTSPTEATVKIDVSQDRKQWKTVLEGRGVKQP